jgi:3-dehydroquinate dehydratase-1
MTFPSTCPAVVGVISTRDGLRLLSRSVAADVIEVRADALLSAGVDVEEVESVLRTKTRPVLLTLRIAKEGGRYAWKTTSRRALFLRWLPLVEAIDVELVTVSTMAPVMEAAQRLQKTIVLSAHALDQPAGPSQFAAWVDQYASAPAGILKIAARIGSWRDLQQLAAVLVNYPEWQVAVMGIGPHAAQSRHVLAALGSRLVYGYLDTPSAPGQPSVSEVRKMVSKLDELRG